MGASQPSSPPLPDLIELLEGAEVLSRIEDLRSIFRTAAEYAMHFLEGSYGLLFAVRFSPPDLTVSLLGCCVSDGTDTYWDHVCDGQSWLPFDPLLPIGLIGIDKIYNSEEHLTLYKYYTLDSA